MFDLNRMRGICMLKVRKYSISELAGILGTADKQGIDRKLTRYGVEFSSSGWADKREYDITNINDPFKVYCVLDLGIPAQATFEKIRNLYYYFFCVEGFTDLPLIEMAKVMEAEGVPASRQFVSRWINYLRHLDYISFTQAECEYYAISRDEANNRICKEITKEEYCNAWCIYFEWRDIEGCGSAYTRMYNTIGGHPYKKPIYRQNALKYEEIEYLIDLIIDTLPEPD